ncbi:MAG: hypothetical protein ACTSUV_04465 [Candidatus Ranarchaeia archaeon]
MGNTQMVFRRSTPSGHSIVIGLSEEDNELVDKLATSIESILETEFKNRNWDYIDRNTMENFEKKLKEEVLVPTFHDHGGFEDTCSMGDNCLIKTSIVDSPKRKIWNTIKEKYQNFKAKLLRL